MADSNLSLPEIVFKYESNVKEIAAMFPSMKFLAIAATLKHFEFDYVRTVDAILENTDKWEKAADAPVESPKPPPANDVNPLRVSDGTKMWIDEMKRQQQLLWEQTELARQRREEETKSLQFALLLKEQEELQRKEKEEEEAKSMAIIKQMMQEEEERKRQKDLLDKVNEEAAKELLEKEKQERQRELENKEYPCSICYGDFKIRTCHTMRVSFAIPPNSFAFKISTISKCTPNYCRL